MKTQTFRVLLFYPNETLVGVAPSNLAILSACLKQGGFETRLFDCSMYRSSESETQDSVRAKLGQVKESPIDKYVQPHEENVYLAFLRVLNEYKPNLVGFSVVDSTISYALTFARLIDREKSSIIFGGVGAMFNYEKILRSGFVDFVCIGEGEEALVELASRLNNGEDCRNIDNIYTIDESKSIVKNKKRKLVDINKLPVPDFSIYEHERFYRPFMGSVVRMAQVDLDRGCPFTCTYCIAPVLKEASREDGCGNYYRVKSLDKVFDEIKGLIATQGINFLWISSETFLFMSNKKFRELAERYIAEINLPFWCQNRLDMFSEEKTELLAKMGCKAVSIGLEHGSEKVRSELLNKHIPNDKILKSIEVLSRYDIIPTINSMIGLPDETRDEVFETIELNRQIYEILKGKQTINVFTFIPFSGTKLRMICLAKGYVNKDQEISFSFQKESMLTMPSMSKEEIYGLEKTLPLYISMPKNRWGDIAIAEQDNETGRAMFELLQKEQREKK